MFMKWKNLESSPAKESERRGDKEHHSSDELPGRVSVDRPQPSHAMAIVAEDQDETNLRLQPGRFQVLLTVYGTRCSVPKFVNLGGN